MKPGLASAIFGTVAAAVLMLSLFPPASKPVTQAGNTIRDSTGRDVIVPIPGKRVAFMSISLPDYLAITGSAKNVVGVIGYNVVTVKRSLLARIFPGASNVHLIEGLRPVPLLDPEMLIALHPDTAFVYHGVALTPMMEKVGAPGLVEFPSGPQPYTESAIRFWRYIGIITGREQRAETLLDTYNRENQAVADAAPKSSAHMSAVVLFTNVVNTLMEGGANPLADDFKALRVENPVTRDNKWVVPFDLERLLAIDPDVILIDQLRNIDDQHKADEFLTRPEMQALRAVRERKVYRVPSNAFSDEVVDGPLLRRWLAEILYPAAMRPELRRQIRETYREVYGYTVSDDDLDMALLVNENRNSAGYERFTRGSGS